VKGGRGASRVSRGAARRTHPPSLPPDCRHEAATHKAAEGGGKAVGNPTRALPASSDHPAGSEAKPTGVSQACRPSDVRSEKGLRGELSSGQTEVGRGHAMTSPPARARGPSKGSERKSPQCGGALKCMMLTNSLQLTRPSPSASTSSNACQIFRACLRGNLARPD